MRKTLLLVGVCAAAVLIGAPSWAQERSEEVVLPVVAHTQGQGNPPTQWVTDLTIHNLMDQAITVGMAFFPFEHDNDWDFSFPATIQVGPRSTALIEDVLASKFGITSNSKGVLVVTCSGQYFPQNPANSTMIVTSRTYNTGSPQGTYGQTVPSNVFLWNASPTPSTIVGARNDDRFRSNLGIVNLSFNPITVHFRFLAADGKALRPDDKRLIPRASGIQRLFSNLGIDKVAGPITVELWLDAADVTPDPCASTPNYFMAYVSKVDGNPNGTGDAEFLYAVPSEFPPAGFDCP